MQRITVIESRNGWLVVEGSVEGSQSIDVLLARSWTFSSLCATATKVERILESWREAAINQEQSENTEGES